MDDKDKIAAILQALKEQEATENYSGIARIIGMSPTNFHKAVHGLPDSKGTVVKIPKRCHEGFISWAESKKESWKKIETNTTKYLVVFVFLLHLYC